MGVAILQHSVVLVNVPVRARLKRNRLVPLVPDQRIIELYAWSDPHFQFLIRMNGAQ